ncbi:MAG: 3-deoxy-D-manno-octulosonic acid transferase [Alistipes sp.]|nr:3-deoxy-D-manno-octulosonic acid transferase [Alistipes sp.]
MFALYNLIIYIYTYAIKLISPWNEKAQLWCAGRKDIFSRMAAAIKPSDRVIWIHSASLGEFEQGRPIIELIREKYPQYKILLTFFSPSGYEIRKNYNGADYIFYLPADTPSNVRQFLDIAHPEITIIVKYEFWLNYLKELKERNIRTFLISSIFRQNSIFFKKYGMLWRHGLDCFEQIFVQNQESLDLLHEIGFDNVIVAGDTRFDRVAEIAKAAKTIDIIEAFKGESRLFVAGSTWGPDEDILIELINSNPDVKFIIAPHEMEQGRINKIITSAKFGAKRYTQCSAEDDFSSCQVLILDTIGILSSVYGYATWSYIGGGFGVGIHNTLEAATFGLPIAFGPNYHKFKEARDMVALGAATKVENSDELKEWFKPLKDNPEHLAKTSTTARDYTQKNQGATALIMKIIFAGR